MRILVIEDDPGIRSIIERELAEQRYTVDTADNGEDGEYLAFTNDYDAIVLDLMLPKKSGKDVCRALRADGVAVPILMLTALGEEEDMIKGLDLGADDYLVKPVSMAVLMARLRSLIRRTAEQKSALLQAADLQLDTARRTVLRGGQPVALSTKEFQLLEYMMHNRDRVLTRDMIAEHVWDMHFDPRSNVIESLVRMLRIKVDRGHTPQLIHTVRGSGYRFSEED